MNILLEALGGWTLWAEAEEVLIYVVGVDTQGGNGAGGEACVASVNSWLDLTVISEVKGPSLK